MDDGVLASAQRAERRSVAGAEIGGDKAARAAEAESERVQGAYEDLVAEREKMLAEARAQAEEIAAAAAT